MQYSEVLKVTYKEEEGKITVSIAVTDDVVVVKKISIDQFRKAVAQMNAVVYEIDNK